MGVFELKHLDNSIGIYDMQELIVFAKQMDELCNFHRQRVRFQDICYGSWIDFEMDGVRPFVY